MSIASSGVAWTNLNVVTRSAVAAVLVVTVLLANARGRAQGPPSEQFSIRCILTQPFFVTFDLSSKRVVYESEAGTALKGHVNSATDGEIRFDLLRVGSPKFELVWSQRESRLTSLGLPNDPSRPTQSVDCTKMDPRPILSIYDRIAPYE